MSGLTACPDCGARMKRENVERHRSKLHPAAEEGSAAMQARRNEREEGRKSDRAAARRRGISQRGVLLAALALLAGGAVACGFLLAPSLIGPGGVSPPPPDPSEECANHGGIGIHWHVVLKIYVGGSQVPIPANVGIEPGCMHPLHTHGADGVIHVEYRYEVHFTLGQFFDLWGQPFGKDRLLDRTGPVTASLDGRPAGDQRHIPLLDRSTIEVSIN